MLFFMHYFTPFTFWKAAVEFAKSKDLPIVIDADGLYIVSVDTSVICGYEKCILTPNLMEFKHLYEAAVILTSTELKLLI